MIRYPHSGSTIFRIRVGVSPPSSGKCHSKDKRKEDEEKPKPRQYDEVTEKIKVKKEDG